MKRFSNISILLAAMMAGLAFTPSPAEAYMGIGGSLGILAAALGMMAAFVVSAFTVLMTPFRALKRWLSGAPGQPAEKPDEVKADQPADGAEHK